MIELLGELGADIGVIVIAVGAFAAAATSGYFVSEKAKNKAAGWTVGIAGFIALSVMFAPAIEALQQV